MPWFVDIYPSKIQILQYSTLKLWMVNIKYLIYKEIPKFVSKDARDLIKSILTIDPKTRISIQGIRNHPFMKKISLKIIKGINVA